MTTENNNDEIARLKNQVFTLLVALVVVSGTLSVYLYNQTRLVGKDITQGRQLEGAMKQSQDAMGGFVGALMQYAQKHPEFVPVLKKNGIPLVSAPAAAPAAPAAAPKK